MEDGRKVSDDIDDTKDEAVLAPHGQVRATSVAGHGFGGGCRGEEIVHRGDRTDLLGRAVHREDEHEYDDEQYGGVRAANQLVRKRVLRSKMRRTSHREASRACHQLQHR